MCELGTTIDTKMESPKPSFESSSFTHSFPRLLGRFDKFDDYYRLIHTDQ